MSGKKLMTPKELMKAQFWMANDFLNHYGDVDLDEVAKAMQSYAKHVMENVMPDKTAEDGEEFEYGYSDHNIGFNSCIDQMKENAKQIGIEI